MLQIGNECKTLELGSKNLQHSGKSEAKINFRGVKLGEYDEREKGVSEERERNELK